MFLFHLVNVQVHCGYFPSGLVDLSTWSSIHYLKLTVVIRRFILGWFIFKLLTNADGDNDLGRNNIFGAGNGYEYKFAADNWSGQETNDPNAYVQMV